MHPALDKSSIHSEELEELLREREEGKIDFLLVDVREDMEYKMGHIKGGGPPFAYLFVRPMG